MIEWPDEKKVKSEGREGLRRFRETSAAAELETSKEKWNVVAWPWTTEPPMRVVLENAAHRTVTVSMNADGSWMFLDDARAVHERSIEALDRDARGV